MRARVVLLALVTCMGCEEKKHAPEPKAEKEHVGATPAGEHGGAQHASGHEPAPVPPEPESDPGFFPGDQPARATIEPKFKACYAKALKLDPAHTVVGSALFWVRVATNGKALETKTIYVSGLPDPLMKCLTAAALTGKFAAAPYERWAKFPVSFTNASTP